MLPIKEAQLVAEKSPPVEPWISIR